MELCVCLFSLVVDLLILTPFTPGHPLLPLCSTHWSSLRCLGEEIIPYSRCLFHVCTHPNLAHQCHVSQHSCKDTDIMAIPLLYVVYLCS